MEEFKDEEYYRKKAKKYGKLAILFWSISIVAFIFVKVWRGYQ